MMPGTETEGIREFRIPSDGISLHAKLHFPKTEKERYHLVIVVHGFTGHMEEPHIAGLTETLAENGFAALRVELYGHGKSDGLFKDHTILKWITELIDVVDYAAGLDFVSDLSIVGHSQGGLAVMLLAALKHDQLRAVVPLAPGLSIPDNARKGECLGASFDPQHIPEKVVFPDKKILGGNYFRVAQMISVEEAIRRYSGPVLLVHADTDETVPAEVSVRAAQQYENARLCIIENDTHCFDNKLPEMEEAVVGFLKEVLKD